MKCVWILNHYAIEPGGAGGTRHFSLAQGLLRHGWNASVIAASVDLNGGRQRLMPGENARLEVIEEVPFLWLRTPTYAGNGAGRMRNMLAYAARVMLPASTRALSRPDAIVGSSVHPFAALAGALLARRHRVPFIFEVRDLWPQTLIDMRRLKPRSVMAWLLRRLELWLYRRASRIIVLLPRAVDYIAPLGIPAGRVVWIPNGVDSSLFGEGQARPSSTEGFTLMYFGAHGQANGLDLVLRAMQRIAQLDPSSPVRLRLIGDGPKKAELVELARELKLDNVSFEPPVSKRSIPQLAASADAFVIAVLDLPHLYRYGISMNKLFDYLAASRPIVIASAAANNPVAEAGAGITVPPADPEALAQAIIALARMPPEARHRLGLAGRRHVATHYDFDRLAARLSATLDAAVAEHA